MNAEKRDGLQRMLGFLELLSNKGIHYFIEQDRPDSLMVTFTMVGIRVEVDFFVDHFEFSVFRGNEDVEVDERILLKLIKDNWD
jgi:hypothetical protein